MKPGVPELRWAYVALFLLLGIEILVAARVPTSTKLPLLGLLFVFHLLALWLIQRLTAIVRGYRLLKESYEQELDFARQVMDSSSQGMVVMDARGRFAYVNRTFGDFLGQPPEAFVGRVPADFLVPHDREVFQNELRERWSGKKNVYTVEACHADGHTVRLRVVGTPRWHQGRIVGNFATMTRLAEEEAS